MGRLAVRRNPSLKDAVRTVQAAQYLERRHKLIREGKHAKPPAAMPPAEKPLISAAASLAAAGSAAAGSAATGSAAAGPAAGRAVRPYP